MPALRILHVIECEPEGGVVLAARSLIERLPEAEHHIATVHDLGHIANVKQHRLSGGVYGRVAGLRRLEKELQPALVHAHSSWAGCYSRLVKLNAPVLYQPHCFYFDNPGGTRAKRIVYKLAERVLARRAQGVITLTEHEGMLAASIGFKPDQILHVPNVSVLTENTLPNPHVSVPAASGPGVAPILVMIGRAAAQKDPSFFAESVRLLHRTNPEVQAVWVGDGEARSLLEAAGVQVTGWLTPEQVRSVLINSNIYLHSASYEGFPLSVLDAAQLSMPIIVRDLHCFDGSVLAHGVRTPEEAAAAIRRLLASSLERTSSIRRSQQLSADHSTQIQRRAILKAYRWALGADAFCLDEVAESRDLS